MYRIGQSTDIHQLVKDRPLILGGVNIPFELGLLGHSDADVLTHAVIESIIGALGKGDIGGLFPDTDPVYHNISSLELLRQTVILMHQAGYQIGNIDSLIILEKPLLAKYIPLMKENLANVLHVATQKINIKATRPEKLGFIGRQEGIMAQAVVLLERVLDEKD